jgi:uncharacterized phage protein gp47/JayE
MARIIATANESTLKANLESRIKTRLGEVSTTRDSTTNILSSSIGDELVSLRRELGLIYNDLQLSNASGVALDRIAFNMYGLNRKPATFAFSPTRERNVHFYTTEGIFGYLNNGNSILIPAGTIISNETTRSTNSIVYQLTEDLVLNAEDRIAYCDVQATNVGSSYNVDSDSLIYHNFTNYAGATNNSLKVTNTFPIVNGSETESDDSLRFRVTNYLQAQTNLNIDAVTLKALSLPGVLDVEVIPSYYGIGTTGVVLFGSGREASKNLTTLMERRLSELTIPGQQIIVSEGIRVYFDFDIRVYIKQGINEIEKSRARDNVRRAVIRAIKDKEFTKTISFAEISSIIKREFRDTNILGFGTSNNSNSVFENVFIRKTDRMGLLPEEKESLLLNSYTVARDERISFGLVNIILEEQSV